MRSDLGGLASHIQVGRGVGSRARRCTSERGGRWRSVVSGSMRDLCIDGQVQFRFKCCSSVDICERQGNTNKNEGELTYHTNVGATSVS